jgi:guanylate cyclase
LKELRNVSEKKFSSHIFVFYFFFFVLGLSEILHEGGPDLYMQFFGECFVKFFTNYGYDKILRVAGRHFRDFLHSIDQLHDSTRFSFPKMKSPLFHVTEEDDNGAVLHYK